MNKLNLACIGFAGSGKSAFVQYLQEYANGYSKSSDDSRPSESYDSFAKDKSSLFSLNISHNFSDVEETKETKFFSDKSDKKKNQKDMTHTSILEINVLTMPDISFDAHETCTNNTREKIFIDLLEEAKKIQGINACLVFIDDESKEYISDYVSMVITLLPRCQIIFIDNCANEINAEELSESTEEKEIFKCIFEYGKKFRFITSGTDTKDSPVEHKSRRDIIMRTILSYLTTKQAPIPSLDMKYFKIKTLEVFETQIILPYLYNKLCELIKMIFDIKIVNEKSFFDEYKKKFVTNRTERKYFNENEELFLRTLMDHPTKDDLAKYMLMLFSLLNPLIKDDWAPSVKTFIKNADSIFTVLEEKVISLTYYPEMYNCMKSYNENQSKQNKDSFCVKYRICLEQIVTLAEKDKIVALALAEKDKIKFNNQTSDDKSDDD
jgi:hypothetical protein